MENRPCGHGGLQTASFALHQVTMREIEYFGVPAPWTTVALWPAGGDQVRPACRFVREAALELRQGLRKIWARHEKYTTPGEGSESTG